MRKFTWVGPTGHNAELGSVKTGDIIDIKDHRVDYFKKLGLIKEEKKTEISTKSKTPKKVEV